MVEMSKQEESSAVLPQKFGGGPHGVGETRSNINQIIFAEKIVSILSGDPNDRTLRRVEKEVII